MFIEEIIIDGFKSYATRTVVSGFDRHFNAITGLNGSGKSNILDAICFVLGISNLSQVRVGNLQELVYKQGQAGVSKASVTILFNNSDPTSSPVGYEQSRQITITRQIVIGGRNKYLINGHTAQLNQVQNLFHSVQLNVNNPHFLIMQGRITKVLNMKPPEILGMIEEAAGTRMFETKKQAALHTIEKKQAKVEEINKILAEEITPTLEKLRAERSHYLQWSSNNTEIERLERFCIAYQYLQALELVNKSSTELQTMQNNLKRLENEKSACEEQISSYDEMIAELTAKRDKEMEKGYKKAKDKEEKLSKELVKINSVLQHENSSLNKENDSIKGIKQQIIESEATIEASRKKISDIQEEITKLEEISNRREEELKQVQQEYQSMCAGISTSREDGMTLTDQIAHLEKEANTAEAQITQSKMKMQHLTIQVEDLKKEMKAFEKEYAVLEKTRKQKEIELDNIKQRLSEIDYSEDMEAKLWNEKAQEQLKVEKLRETVDRLSAQLEGRLSFNYMDPVRGFDRSKVKGVVAKLITLRDPGTSTALEVTAGGKLYQVVVEDVDTSKLLLQKGNLRKRVTIIPLDKISHHIIERDKMNKARQIASQLGGSVYCALELIGFDNEVRNAMEYVFGTTLVCDSIEIAKAVTYDRTIRRSSVTLDGQVFEPSGTLTGGSSDGLGLVLQKLQELSAANCELEQSEKSFKEIENRLEQLSGSARQHSQITQQYKLKKSEFDVLCEQMAQTSHSQLTSKLESANNSLEEMTIVVEKAQIVKQEAMAKLEQLRGQEDSFRARREQTLAAIEKSVANAKKRFQQASENLKHKNQEKKAIELELERLIEEKSSLDEQLIAAESCLNEMQSQVSEQANTLNEKHAEYSKAKTELDLKNHQLADCNEQLKTLLASKDEASKRVSAIEIEIKKLQHQLNRFNKDQGAAQKTITTMQKKYEWIQTEQNYFGLPHTDYDFNAKDPAVCQRRLQELQEEQQTLSKKINKKVMGMIEKAESEYQELMRKRKVIETDKKKIESVIVELDVKKNQALQTTWVKVNRDFGSIFSTLLPGTSAKLEPPEGCTVLDGLEVKVAFGNVWKQTLTELSGGQRSLLALSLILSLLLFKPAPMYILDEVDAALDLSHTQNIGAMLKTHFSQSQFIVVSLKEGMFNNANVIFRTKFVDGVSAVTRTINSSVFNPREIRNSNNENNRYEEEEKEINEDEPMKKRRKRQNKN